MISSQARHLPQHSLIKLLARIAARISGKTDFDFSADGWSKFKDAQSVRNRITHPKSVDDLSIGTAEVRQTLDAFFWLFESVTDVMETGIEARKSYLGKFEETLQKLKSGDPDTVTLYKALRDRDE